MGETIQFNMTSKNTGNVEITGGSISNELFRHDDGTYGMGCPESIPDPWLVGKTFTCTPDYTISQDDIDAGSVSSTTRVDGYLPLGDAVTTSSTATQTLHRTAGVATSVNATMRDSDSVAGDSAGDTIQYIIKLINEGTTTLTGINVSSALLMA
ncbi:unnamed protein product, partial [Sphacelaria rigidula]